MDSLKGNKFLHSNIALHLPNNILRLMMKKRMSDSDLARAVRLPYNTIKRLTTGETTDPKISTLFLIADFFEVGIDALLKSSS